MKIEIEIPDNINNEKFVLCKVKEPIPIIYINVFETGDVWYKIQGCEACSIENRLHCCGGCPMSNENGCFIHLKKGRQKPFQCVVDPTPNKTWSWCALEFECLRGSKKGTIRKIREPIPWLL